MKKLFLILFGVLLTGLAACTEPSAMHTTPRETPGASTAPMPIYTPPSKEELGVFQCIKSTGYYNGKRVAVGQWTDATRKVDAFGGDQLPGGSSGAVVALQSVSMAGARAFNRFNTQAARESVVLGGAQSQRATNAAATANFPHMTLSGYYTSLDFSGGPSVDLRIGGIGPMHKVRYASVGMSVTLTNHRTEELIASTEMKRSVGFQQTGFSTGRNWENWGSNGTVTTGGLSVSDQQALQASSLGLYVRLGVAKAMINALPNAKSRTACNARVTRALAKTP